MVSALPPARTGVCVRVPAKINLALKVGPPRRDGFHPIATVFHAVSLYDELTALPGKPGGFRVRVTGEDARLVPTGNANLAVRAANLLARSHGIERRVGVELSLAKGIPVAGGLAGGSGDAAAALVACAGLWGLDVGHEDLRRLAAELGSDVPFALFGGTAVGTGRGEQLVPALAHGTFHWVLAFGHQGLATPDVYRRFDRLNPHPPAPTVPHEVMNALRAGDPRRLGPALVNDLQAAALDLRPGLARTLAAGLDHGALGAIVSGSGPTVAFLAADEERAVDLTVAVSTEGVCRAVRRAAGPVAGARAID